MPHTVEQSPWKTVFERVQAAQTVLLLGATDTGKTTFLIWLANALQAQGRGVAIVDTDVGQSSVGPPTTIGLAMAAHPMQTARELVPVDLYFVGSMSPRAHLLPIIVGTKRMVDRGRALGVDHVLVDTCGFIAGGGGRALKQHKIDLVAPDVIVCFQRGSECEGILQAYRRSQRPQVIRLEASIACRQRSMAERRSYRERSLQRYFASTQSLSLPWDALNLYDTPLWRGVAVAELGGTLLGLLDEAGETLGLGLLQEIDFTRRHMAVLAPRLEGVITGVRWSRTRLGPRGELVERLGQRTV